MNELILLCAGAAADTAADTPRHDGFVPPASAALNALLARGGVVSDQSLHGDPMAELPEEAWLRERFGVPPASAIQALAACHHAVPMPCWRLTPCHLHLAMDHALLSDPTDLQLTPDDAAALATAATESFEAAGLRLLAPTPDTWFVLGEPWDLQAWPWTLASGRDISAYQPAGPRARDWRRLLTEVQMRWHDHPVNLRRTAAGHRPVNSLWLDGFAHNGAPASTGTLVARSSVLAGLATAAGWSVHRLAADPMRPDACRPGADELARLLANDNTPTAAGCTPTGNGRSTAATGPILIDLDGWRTARRLGDVAAWQAAWSGLGAWLESHAAPLRAAAGAGCLRVVLTGERRVLTLTATPAQRWRFWHRFDARAAIAGQ